MDCLNCGIKLNKNKKFCSINCHSLTSTYKGANKNGRKSRKKYSN